MIVNAPRALWWGLLAAAALGWVNGLGPQDSLLMDQMTRLNGRPVSANIVIAAIDDRSIAELGRWPWRRQVHAQLLDRLQAAGAGAVGLDIIFSDDDLQYPGDDLQLAQATQRAGMVVLPLRMEQIGNLAPMAALPRPALAQAAHALGHVHVELDNDGIARSVFLREGTAERWWSHWALELLATAGHPLAQTQWPGARREAQAATSSELWLRDYHMQIPFAGPPNSYKRASYVDILDGQVPVEQLRGKIVLVGATAAGLGDAYPAPVTSQNGIMPGVEISANVLDALQHGVTLRRAAPWENALFTVAALLLALYVLRHLPGRVAGVAVALLLLLVFGAAVLVQRWTGVQLAPGAALLCLALSYPLWSWRRLERAMHYLGEEFARTRQSGNLLLPVETGRRRWVDELEQRIRAMSAAAEQLRSLQRFVRQSMDALPDPMLVTDTQGQVLLSNHSAEQHFGQQQPLVGAPIKDLLLRRLRGPDGLPLPDLPELWAAMQPLLAQTGAVRVRELQVEDTAQRTFLLKAVDRLDDYGMHLGWIVSLVDVNMLLQAQRQHEEALRFLSHDLRSPISSILTLLELQKAHPQEASTLQTRVATHAQNALHLADSFVQLARAQDNTYMFEMVNLADVVLDAAEQFWARARALGVTVATDVPEAACYGWVERALLTRAVANLVDNALKHSPAGSRVLCALTLQGHEAAIEVRDQGPGIAPEQQEQLFKPFQRVGETRYDRHGVGLGLAFVHTVVLRHRGHISLDSAPGQGTSFTLRLPLHGGQDAEGPPSPL